MAFLAAVVPGLFVLAPALHAQNSGGSPPTDLRLWCPADIETYATMLPYERVQIRSHPFGQPIDDLDYSEAAIMRRVAYGILKEWPTHPAPAVIQQAGIQPGLHRLDLLKAVWRQWKSERDVVFRAVMPLGVVGLPVVSRVLPESGYDDAVREVFERWLDRWGVDPQEPPQPHPSIPYGWLPDELDCRWYLLIDHEDQANGVFAKAVFSKISALKTSKTLKEEYGVLEDFYRGDEVGRDEILFYRSLESGLTGGWNVRTTRVHAEMFVCANDQRARRRQSIHGFPQPIDIRLVHRDGRWQYRMIHAQGPETILNYTRDWGFDLRYPLLVGLPAERILVSARLSATPFDEWERVEDWLVNRSLGGTNTFWQRIWCKEF